MERVIRRKPYQGLTNIIRFNWHFYVVAFGVIVLALAGGTVLNGVATSICIVVALCVITPTVISLIVSYIVYDRSNLYKFLWLDDLNEHAIQKIVNIHSGFDETSGILRVKYPDADLQVFDFYNPERHTEISIERARKAYPQFEGTSKITTNALPLEPHSVDVIFNIFALHEIRDHEERNIFLKQQKESLKSDGKIILVEHLRDIANFLAYNIGFFHFLPQVVWESNFRYAQLVTERKFQVTPFVTIFILKKEDGNAS